MDYLLNCFFFFLLSQGHSLSDNLDDVQRAEMKAYMELVNNMLLTAEVRTRTATESQSCASKAARMSFNLSVHTSLPRHSSTSSGAMTPQLLR